MDKIWRCLTYVKKTKVEKLEARSLKGCFVGYLFYVHDDQWIIVALQAHFMEDEFIQEDGVGRLIVLNEQNETPKEPIVQEQQTKTYCDTTIIAII